MSTQTGTRRQSWRQPGIRPTAGGRGSIRRRKIITAMILAVFVFAALGLAIYLTNIRDQHTRVATLLTASPTKTGDPEEAYTWLPLRFGSESLAPLTAESSEYFQVAELTSSFDNAENLKQAVDKQIQLLKRDDSLILWIRAKGAEINGKAYLLNGTYHLPASSQELDEPQGAIPFKTIVDAAANWTGPVMIFLDWGNQLCDPRAGVWDNRFLSLAVEDIKSAHDKVFCLVSHQQGELSLDSLASRQTLFGRACAEGIVGPRRVPPTGEDEFYVQHPKKLLVGDLAEYVIRRVQADSAKLQRPWLIRGKTGWVNPDRQNWIEQTQVPLATLSGHRRPIGWPELPKDKGDVAEENQGADKKKPPDEGDGSSSAKSRIEAGSSSSADSESPDGLKLSDETWPTGKVWQALDGWREPSNQLAGWSFASLAPLSARRLATMALDLEHRWLAGTDFHGETIGTDLRRKIDELHAKILQEQKGISSIAKAGPLAAALISKPVDISEFEYANWRQRVDAMSAYRQLALILNDTVSLSDNLAKINSVSGNLVAENTAGINVVKRFLQKVSMSSTVSGDGLRPTDAVELARELLKTRTALQGRIEELVLQATRSPPTERILAELLSRYSWLSHAQRKSLLLSMMAAEPADPNANWPSKDLALMRVDPPQSVTPNALPRKLLRIDLVDAATMESVAEAALSVPHLVTLLSQAANALSETKVLTEASWLLVDSRDLCQKEIGWPPDFQIPALPAAPQPQPSWQFAWQNVVRGQLGSSNRLQLYSTSEPTNIDLVLTRIGAVADIESVEIQLTGGLQARIAEAVTGADTNWQSAAIKLNRDELLRVVDLKANAQRLPLELRALNADSQSPLEVQVRVVAGEHSPSIPPLLCRLPAAVPVEVKVQQQVNRDGVVQWIDCDREELLTTIRPFPGRKTEFRLRVTNMDSLPRDAYVELYSLPARSTTDAKGRIGPNDLEIPLELERQSTKFFNLIAKSSPIKLEPNAQDIEVDFASSAPPAAGASTPPAAATAPAGSTKDISWGMVAVVKLLSESTLEWRNWIQVRPVMATDFLTTSSTVSRDAESINLDVALKDANGDSLPDWLPTDLSDDLPIVLTCEIGGGLDKRSASVNMPQQNLTKDKSRQVFTISSQAKIEDEVELQLTVDGSARALFQFVAVGGRPTRSEPPDRIKLRSIGIKDGTTYLNDFQRNMAENQRLLDNYGAMFKRPVPAVFDILLAVDAESRGRADAASERGSLMLKLPTSREPVPIGDFLGDRDLVASLTGSPSKTFTVTCQLTDWRFSYDPRALSDIEATFQGSIGKAQSQVLAKLVLDGSGPVLAQAPNISAVVQGQPGKLSFSVTDSLPIETGVITIGKAGQPTLAAPNGEKLTSSDFSRTSKGFQFGPRTLIVEEMDAGNYDVRAQLSDRLGNTSEFGPWRLVIKPKPVPPPATGGDGKSSAKPGKPLKGNINGRIFFGATKNKSPNDVTVAVKDLPEKTATSSDGKFTITDLDAGEYTLEAKTEWQGAMYKGEAKVKLLKKEDYQKLIDITLVK